MVKKASLKKVEAKKKIAPKKIVKKVAVKKSATKSSREVKGIPELLRDAALKVLDERQAEDIISADLRGKSAMADYAIIASGRSGRQLAAIADHLGKAFADIGVKRIKIEGLQQGDWVLIDAGDIIVHLFRPEVRRYYHIEDIWSHKPRGV